MYSWDENKRQTNLEKHGADFADMERFDWGTALILEDAGRVEIRFRAFGAIAAVSPSPTTFALSASARPTPGRSDAMSKRPIIHMPTPEEEAAINAGIAADPDNPELTDEE